ncbi:MAG: M4 family metallopeptidase [Candidatus Microthrix sp.]|nr:M4 family metallopeptidase [Candidatus Microthrix sp.]
MAIGFHRLTMNTDDFVRRAPPNLDFQYIDGRVTDWPVSQSNEVVARRYLDLAMGAHRERSAFNEIYAEQQPGLVPDLRARTEVPSPYDENTLVRFEQVHRGIRVHGSTAYVELNRQAELMHLGVQVADAAELRAGFTTRAGAPGAVGASGGRALSALLRRFSRPVRPPGPQSLRMLWIDDVLARADSTLFYGSPSIGTAMDAAELVLYCDASAERFRLCWLVPDVVAAAWSPETSTTGDDDTSSVDGRVDDAGRYGADRDGGDVMVRERGDGLGLPLGGWESSRYRRPAHDLLLDAATAELVVALPTARAIEIPVLCTGLDEDGVVQTFDARQLPEEVELVDTGRSISTYDFGLRSYVPDPDPTLPDPADNADAAWGDTNRAAITGHVHTAIVHDFFQSVLQWRGFDGVGSPVTTVVNCSGPTGISEWPSGLWVRGRMICGQTKLGSRNVSWARHLDVLAHEYTHGVTHQAVDLDYHGECGALDESLCDIFGVLVVNWYANRTDPSTWTWELGAGMGADRGPLRDLSDPAQGTPPQPVHMSDWRTMISDNGGVHLNSGIHNKAAHLLMTSRLSTGEPWLSLEEAARAFSFATHGLSSNATFADARQAVHDTVERRHRSDLAILAERMTLIDQAYSAVGIT